MRLKYHNTPALDKLANYISGYSDGEGCFCVSFTYRPKNIKIGWEIKPSFAIGQNANRSEVLFLIKKYFNCGSIRKDKDTLKYEVRSINDLLNYIIPHFEKFPIISAKQKDFILFKDICWRIKKQEHLSEIGIKRIIKLAYKMNGSGKRKFSVQSMIQRVKSR